MKIMILQQTSTEELKTEEAVDEENDDLLKGEEGERPSAILEHLLLDISTNRNRDYSTFGLRWQIAK